jgi:raffinose/stachyose/melibiose transport system substrate-binding protein
MFKKGVGITLAVFILLSIIAPGCSNNESQTTTSGVQTTTQGASQSAEKVTIRVLANFSNPQQAQCFADRLKAFADKYPNIIIDDWSTGDENVFFDKFKTGVAQGDPPEIFVNYGGESQADYAKNKVMADLTDILNSDKAWSDNIPKNLFDQWQFQDIPGIYGVPYAVFAIGIYYNKDLFSQIGKEPPKTFDDLLEASELFIAKGITPLALGVKDAGFGGHFFGSLMMKAFGSQKALDLASRKAKWNDKDMVDLFSFLKQLADKGVFGENIATLDYNGSVAAFENETSAMHSDGTWYLGSAINSPIKDKIGFIQFPYFSDKPQFKDSMMGGATGAFCMSGLTTGAKREAAISLLKFITSVEHNRYMWDRTGGGFITPMSLADLGVDPASVNPITKDFIDVFSKVTDLKNEAPIYDSTISLLDVERDRIQGIFAGSITPQQAADQIQAAIDNN